MTNPLPTLSNIPNSLPKSQADWQAFQIVLNQWKQTLGPPKWQTPTLLNGWANFGMGFMPAGYFIDLTGRVWLRGFITGGAGGTTAFTLPCAPLYRIVLPTIGDDSSSVVAARIDVDTSGNVIAALAVNPPNPTLGWITLDSLSFSLLP